MVSTAGNNPSNELKWYLMTLISLICEYLDRCVFFGVGILTIIDMVVYVKYIL